MIKDLSENVPILDFTYLTAAFIDFIDKSNKNFKEAVSIESQKSFNNKMIKKSNTDITEVQFTRLNTENLVKYLENLDLIEDEEIEKNEGDTKLKKLKFIKSVFGNSFINNELENIIQNLSKKMNFSIFNEQSKLVTLLSEQTTAFLFKVYQYISKIIKNMKDRENKYIQDLVAKNILEEEKIREENKKVKAKLCNESIHLINNIESLNQILNKKNKIEEQLLEKNNNLEIEKESLIQGIKRFENLLQIKEKDLKKELKNVKSELNDLKKEFGDISDFKNKIDELNNLKRDHQEQNEFEKEFDIFKRELNDVKTGLSDMNNKVKELGESKTKLTTNNNMQKDSIDANDAQNKIEKLNKEIKEIVQQSEEFKERYNHMKLLNIEFLLSTLHDLPLKSENKDEMVKYASKLSPESEIRGLRRVINLLFYDYDTLEHELSCLKESIKKNKSG